MDVADAFIGELVERLVQVAEENTWLVLGIKAEIYNLVDDLKLFKANLKKASAHESANHVLKDVVDKILNVVSDAEDAICKYSMEKRKHTVKGIFSFGFAKEIQNIRGKVKKIQQDHAQAFQALIYKPNSGTSTRQVLIYKPGTLLEQLVDRLVQVVVEDTSLIIGIKDQIEELMSEVTSLNAYLKQASKSQSANDNDILRDVLEKVRHLLIDAEDIIAMHVVMRKKYKDKGVLRCLETPDYYAKVKDYGKGIDALTRRVRKIRQDCHQYLQVLIDNPNPYRGPAPQMMAHIPVVEEEDVVGLDNEVEMIKNRLLGGSKELTVISIGGMAGLGKTTLTKTVFKDRDIEYEFMGRLWVYVSRTFNRRQIFLNILRNFTKETKDFLDMSEENLAERINEFLRNGKYLVVIDDIWTVQDWEFLKIAFAKNENGSRVLVTTQNARVASHADSNGSPHQLKFLEDEESWELLKRKVFRKEECPPQLENLGRSIAIKCNGLPLAVVVIAGVLTKNSTPSEWKRVADDPFPVINRENQSYNDLVKMSYDHLPSDMKDCFLYLATFPRGHEIAAWKLISLWIAEGFIPLTEGGYTSDLEHTAEKYLDYLVERNFVMVLKRRADGQIKTCGIHNTLHEFCRTEATKKNLFQEMDGAIFEVNNNICRRICVRSNILELLRSENKQSNEHVRSFLSSSLQLDIPNECLAAIPKSFPLLRVINVESLKFSMLPKEFFLLYNLRFLAITTDLNILPKLFNNLSNMETLVLYTTQNSLEVKADQIWSMRKLRHVYSNTSVQLPPPPPPKDSSKNSSSSASIDLKTLCTISPSSCTAEILNKTPDLQKLGIRGNLVELLESNNNGRGICLFDNLQKLYCLENLKLMNTVHQGSMLQISFPFPSAEKFPSRLRKMTLSNTSFEWKDLSTLGCLDELQVLKLEKNAFRGESCDVSNVVFKRLQYLRIGWSDDLVSWAVSTVTFPVLECLILRHCTMLDVVPSAFAEVETLKVMELFNTNKKAVNSAREIQKQKAGGFQLSIYPPL